MQPEPALQALFAKESIAGRLFLLEVSISQLSRPCLSLYLSMLEDMRPVFLPPQKSPKFHSQKRLQSRQLKIFQVKTEIDIAVETFCQNNSDFNPQLGMAGEMTGMTAY